jgi:deazaflavin-dependent oxidoreductase (nitroreductase family)
MGSMADTMGRMGNTVAVSLYRMTGGRLGGSVRGAKVLLLTVPGRKTGVERTVPVSYVEHDSGYVVAGSNGGRADDPQWFKNLRVADRATAELGKRKVTMRPEILAGDARDAMWRDVFVAQMPMFAKYETKTTRTIPLAVLRPDG